MKAQGVRVRRKVKNHWHKTLFFYLVKCIVLVFLGFLIIGIQKSCTYSNKDMNHIYVVSIVVLKRPDFNHKNMVCLFILLLCETK